MPAPARASAAKGFGSAAEPDPDRLPTTAAFNPRVQRPLGLAIDIGTTTLAAAAVDLASGRTVAAGSTLNPQAEVGADVMSRIQFAGRSAGCLAQLTAAVRRGLAALTAQLSAEASASAGDLVGATAVGNPAMLHLWRGADPFGLGVAPYLGRWTEAVHTRADEVGLPIPPGAPVYVLPCVRSHVGADAVGASVAVGLDISDEPALVIDLGTNSEIVLGSAAAVFAASTAAGPAFECGGISCGMRAANGAIDALHLEPDGRWSVHAIGNEPAAGMCGPGRAPGPAGSTGA